MEKAKKRLRSVYMSDELYRRVKAAAAEDRRSFNLEVTDALIKYLDKREPSDNEKEEEQ